MLKIWSMVIYPTIVHEQAGTDTRYRSSSKKLKMQSLAAERRRRSQQLSCGYRKVCHGKAVWYPFALQHLKYGI
jgi:hypothetical protein